MGGGTKINVNTLHSPCFYGPPWFILPQIFLKKEEETEALKECYSDPFMTSGEVDTLPSSSGLFLFKPTVDQPAPPDALDLPVNLVRLGWVRARDLLIVVLRCVDHWVHRSRLVCKSTRNCVLCGPGDDKLKVGLEEKRAERLLFRAESDLISKNLPPRQLERFRKQDGIWWSTGKFDSCFLLFLFKI